MTAIEVLHNTFGYDSFRTIQENVIDSVLAGHDTLALMPTGGGKSLCFQVPTMVMASEGKPSLCLVITPLIALMKDQVENLKKHNIMAAAIYTGQSLDQQQAALDNCQFGPYHFLYVSPERLESEAFRKRLAQLPVGLIAVDEAHCISQWGYDFRPSYLHISSIREFFNCPLLALTATATPKVVEDICDRLQATGNRQQASLSPYSSTPLPPMRVYAQSFERKNLQYIVRYTDKKDEQLRHILDCVPGSAIVYVRNRKRAQELSELLASYSADFYHAGLTAKERSDKQSAWKDNKTRVIVCTNAFGMGIDKPDVRLVIHYDLPDSIEAYFQEAGRAGRDGKTAYAVLLYNPEDKVKARKRVADNYPTKEFIEDVYHKTCDFFTIGAGSGLGHSFALHMDELARVMHLPLLPTYAALHILSQAGYIDFEEDQEMRARVQLKVTSSQWKQYNLSPEEALVLETLMRRYTGIFSDLQYIDIESLLPSLNSIRLADRAPWGRELSTLHSLLADLAARGLLIYLPRTCACRFTMTQERQETIFLPKRVYEDRKDQYVERLRAMVEYAEQTQFCRSQLLLHYFGQSDAPTCGTCDVCRSR
ncbi:MAG: RecQ family ATP-dependent DNA helicase [Paludibacteraceae bacterium]|nr:RecQ family ATP-dependent DNA helicase [Paludibacteraceae bacterium]